jgi:hypothetical protein
MNDLYGRSLVLCRSQVMSAQPQSGDSYVSLAETSGRDG